LSVTPALHLTRIVCDQLRDILVQLTLDFEIMPGTKPAKAAIPLPMEAFEQADLARSDGG
jgi:hypothetical protein